MKEGIVKLIVKNIVFDAMPIFQMLLLCSSASCWILIGLFLHVSHSYTHITDSNLKAVLMLFIMSGAFNWPPVSCSDLTAVSPLD